MSGVVLASSSPYRQRLLADAGIAVDVIPPDFDERALDERVEWGPDRHVVAVANGKALSVIGRVEPGVIVIAADQIAVLDHRLVTKPGSVDAAVAQLAAMSGRSHDLVNGLVAIRAGRVETFTAVDRHTVTMRPFTEAEARAYVEAFQPLDCVGAYRIEDDADLITSVVGSGNDGVIGLPIAVMRSLIRQLA